MALKTGVQHGNEADRGPKMLGIGRNREHGPDGGLACRLPLTLGAPRFRSNYLRKRFAKTGLCR
jgi:hypothetical protein